MGEGGEKGVGSLYYNSHSPARVLHVASSFYAPWDVACETKTPDPFLTIYKAPVKCDQSGRPNTDDRWQT